MKFAIEFRLMNVPDLGTLTTTLEGVFAQPEVLDLKHDQEVTQYHTVNVAVLVEVADSDATWPIVAFTREHLLAVAGITIVSSTVSAI